MKKAYWAYLLTATLLLFSAAPSFAQLNIGQYEDEAPLQTWNIFGPYSTRSLGMGQVRFVLADDIPAILVNPSLASFGPKLGIFLAGSIRSSTLFRFSLVNTGPIYSNQNLWVSTYSFEQLALAARIKKWGLALSVGLLEDYHRPKAVTQSSYQGDVYHDIQFNQDGYLRIASLALSRRFGQRFSLGLGINAVYGERKKVLTENWYYSDITITDSSTHDIQGYFLNGGLTLKISDRTTLGLLFRSPYERKTESENSLVFTSGQISSVIAIEATSENSYHQPLIIGWGGLHQFSDNLRAGIDLAFFQWSRYEIRYFGEDLNRDFRDILKISAGLEYRSSATLFGRSIGMPLRIGLLYDPQPMADPKSYYVSVAVGSGLDNGRFKLDLGGSVGREFGSGDKLIAVTFLMSISYDLVPDQ